MKIIAEIDIPPETHAAIQLLRNAAFQDHQVNRSYFKQLPHSRMLTYSGEQLIGHMGLDYRVIRVGDAVLKILGVIDFCVSEHARGQGIGSSMLATLSAYAKTRDVDFLMLMSEHTHFYCRHGFQQVTAHHSWLRLHEHQNYGIGFEPLNELLIQPVSGLEWPSGHIDWLGYMF
ncbi:GNAT family N-acetyltransferase [Photobacterium sp. CCB-ST2H9]|uniref:GNAT family N-acetyltransferase n=1 Tax=Photobacterium sp. CCB-ST2H9 TaxID=2912855 RepID=UPI0020059D3B|nr:GNAT family N-acetyltransferase [Photobacterium sp. CCB-ST2H9]UTM59090.1 GNAT family N-acetyltransferase [Photobacterium sp. CCB-ST2H9]